MEFNYSGQEKSAGIYKITNKLNGRIYIGSAKEFKDRWMHHDSLLRNNKHYNKFLQADFNKSGTDAFLFEVLEVVEGTKEERLLIEEGYIKQHYGVGCYNGRVSTTSPEGAYRPNTEEYKKKISAARKETWARPGYKEHMAEMLKPYHQAQAETFTKYSKEAHEKSAEARARNNELVIDPLGKVYNVGNIQEFVIEHGLNKGSLLGVINGAHPSHKGWRKYDESLIGVGYVNQLTEQHFAAKEFRLLSPKGEVFSGKNVSKFCLEHELRTQNIIAILNNRASKNSYKGWRNADNPRFENKKSDFKWESHNHPRRIEFCLKSPDGEIISGINIKAFCIEHDLRPSCISAVLHGNRLHHKGWTKP